MKPTALLLLPCLLFTSCHGQIPNNAASEERTIHNKVTGDTAAALGSSIMVIYQDRKQQYWFGSWETGVYWYDGKTLINYTKEHGLSGNRIDEIQEDSLGNIYFTHCHPTSAITRFDGQSFTTLKPVLSNNWRLQEGDLWFKHAYQHEKVYRYDGTTLHELNLPKPLHQTNRFEIYSIYKDRMGNVWFGTNPVGVCRYNGTQFDWITEEDVTEFRDEGANGVRSMVEDAQGNFWFNTEYRYRIYDSVGKDVFYVRHLSIGGLDGKEDSPLDEYLSVVRDTQNHLWFVTYMDGVWEYDGTKVTHHPVQVNGKDISLFSIYRDQEGTLWLGTHENGAFWWNGHAFDRFEP